MLCPMAKYAICDNCGEKDDWIVNQVPILDGGAVLKLRGDTGSDEFEHTLEICETCKNKLLKEWPRLAEAIAKESESELKTTKDSTTLCNAATPQRRRG